LSICILLVSARFVLIGGRPAGYLGQLRQLIRTAGMKDELYQFLDDVNMNILIEHYHRADMAVASSLNYESSSYLVAYAMSTGLPVIASRVGGIPETVGPNNVAILVEPGNADHLTDAMISLCKNPGLRQEMDWAGQARAKSYFSDNVVVGQIIEFYRLAQTS
jgi:glycosyltransferase involved in cell wall biosynthesis